MTRAGASKQKGVVFDALFHSTSQTCFIPWKPRIRGVQGMKSNHRGHDFSRSHVLGDWLLKHTIAGFKKPTRLSQVSRHVHAVCGRDFCLETRSRDRNQEIPLRWCAIHEVTLRQVGGSAANSFCIQRTFGYSTRSEHSAL